MVKNEKISTRQFRNLVILFTIGDSILVLPSLLAFYSKQDAWIACIISVGIGLLVIALYTKLGLFFPNMTFVQMNEKIFGKWIGKCTSLFFLTVTFLYTCSVMYYVGKFMTIQILPDTPIEMIHIMVAIILVMAVRLGLEVIARAAEIFLVLFIMLFIILVIFVSPQIDIKNIQPVFEIELKPLLRTVIILVVYAPVDSLVLLMIFSASVNELKKARKAYFSGFVIGGIVIIITTLLTILVLGADQAARQAFPGYTLAQKINVGNFVQRIEAILAIMWFIPMYLKMVLFFYGSCLGISQVLGLKNYRPLTLPFGILIVILSLIIFPNIAYQQEWDVNTSVPLSITAELFLALLMLVVAIFRKGLIK
ncbi:GerAB/ArcD/ProY family transporter [Peribacillus butanolivorans]|uniref:GerAB/ArcD/ProY family transporter n=1 Tax=Peribacillus butanolivorans TaxID=421767 RepID=UPI00167F5338|nr:endospore germination permease [Peribacillus butanolivorans]QNU02851.1 endospore germination permease [Peribacillus butanolivorans]